MLFGGNRQVCSYRGETLLRHCRCGSRSGCDLGIYRDEQRGAGCQEEDHDGGRSLYLPYRGSPGTSSVLRTLLNRRYHERERGALSGLSIVQGAATSP